MNAEVATDSALTVLNRHIAHMAESAIQSAAAVAATSSGATHQKSVEECVSYLSIIFFFFWSSFLLTFYCITVGTAGTAAHVSLEADSVPEQSDVPTDFFQRSSSIIGRWLRQQWRSSFQFGQSQDQQIVSSIIRIFSLQQ